MGDTGLEPPPKNTGKTAILGCGGAESGALGVRQAHVDTELSTLIDAWPELSEAIKAGILALIRVAK